VCAAWQECVAIYKGEYQTTWEIQPEHHAEDGMVKFTELQRWFRLLGIPVGLPGMFRRGGGFTVPSLRE
jgi:hypothetical protein